jgi:hypothetical protein
MTDTGKGFWQTVPGMITAVAALITAIGGVLGILVQSGVIGGGDDDASLVTTPAAGDTPAPGKGDGGTSEGPPTDPTGESALVPWAEATATLVRNDGTRTTVKAATVTIACEAENLTFENGQRLSLERVRNVRFDAIYYENSSADGVVTLLDGRRLTDPIHTWNCPVSGTSDLGALDVDLEEIRRIEFHR